MSDYEITLLTAIVVLIASLLTGFSALTNHRTVAGPLLLFVVGGFALFYANSLNSNADLAGDIPGAIFKLYARIMN